MRHRVQSQRLGLPMAERKRVFRSLMSAVITYEKVQTTHARAKAVQPLVEKLITRSLEGTLHSRRLILAELPDERAVRKLFDLLAPRYKDRVDAGKFGGYSRVIKTGRRQGDGAEMAVIELLP